MIRRYTDRSRIQTYQRCPRSRWYEYHEGGLGIVSKRMPMRMAVGIAIHAGLARLLEASQQAPWPWELNKWRAVEDDAVKVALVEFAPLSPALELDATEQAAMQSPTDITNQLAQSLGLSVDSDIVRGLSERVGERRNQFDQYLAKEQAALVEACVRAYARWRLPALLEQFEVLEVEREGTWKLAEWAERELWFMSRPDALLRERSSNELYIQSYKTTGGWDIRKGKDAEHDMQGLSEGIEIERRLGQRIHAIRYEYILTGDRWKDKELSAQLEMDCRSQRSHLIRCYEAVSVPVKSQAFSIGDVCWSWDYTRVEDMKESSLAWQNWKSRPVWDRPGGVKAWIDKLADAAPLMSGDDSTVGMEPRDLGWKCDAQALGVTKQHPLDAVFIPPIVIYRNEDELRDMVEQIEAQEVAVAEHVARVEAASDEGEKRSLLNQLFTQSRRACFYPSECAYTKVCFGGEDIRRDPLRNGGELYKVRELNHPVEGGS